MCCCRNDLMVLDTPLPPQYYLSERWSCFYRIVDVHGRSSEGRQRLSRGVVWRSAWWTFLSGRLQAREPASARRLPSLWSGHAVRFSSCLVPASATSLRPASHFSDPVALVCVPIPFRQAVLDIQHPPCTVKLMLIWSQEQETFDRTFAVWVGTF